LVFPISARVGNAIAIWAEKTNRKKEMRRLFADLFFNSSSSSLSPVVVSSVDYRFEGNTIRLTKRLSDGSSIPWRVFYVDSSLDVALNCSTTPLATTER